jgi:LPS-assembly lipoprotein
MSSSRRALAVTLALLVSACGFQLRGQVELPEAMARTYISAADRQSLFYRKLEAGLRMNGVDVVDSPIEASAVLNILDDDTGRRVLSVSARNVPREYEVYYRIEFSVEAGESMMIRPQEQALVRDYTYDETRVLGKAREEDQLREAIAEDLVRVVMFQLAAL